jgi:hypothetical protein
MKFRRMLVAATLLILGNGTARLDAAPIGMEIPISLEAGQPPDGAWPVVLHDMWSDGTGSPGIAAEEIEDRLNDIIKHGDASTHDEALAVLFHYYIYWGYLDLDGDGVNEMVVWAGVPGWCGTAGCQTVVLGRRPAEWKIVTGFTLEEPTGDLCYTRAGPEGYPMLRSRREAVWWTGTDFDSLCYLACDGWGDPYGTSPEELATYTPKEFAVRDQLHQLPWCGAATGS